ncbi:MAG: hypothetical protein Q9227_005832 [Pyrenula ochraceoflavens]
MANAVLLLTLFVATFLGQCISSPVGSQSYAAVNTSQNTGTFANPSSRMRPKFRYWIPDASVDPSIVASDVHAAASAGAGGLELLGYYLYGGPPSNGAGRGTAAPVSWATYGFGTEAWQNVLKNFAQAIQDEGLVMDFAFGPNQGTGVPAEEGSDGLMWDIAAFNVSVPIGGSFNGRLPGWGTGSLEAAVTGLATSTQTVTGVDPGLPGDLSLSRTQITLAGSSLQDVTDQVGSDGSFSVTFDANATGLNHMIFAIYLVHSDFRAQDGPEDLGGPQTAPQTLPQNGSWAVDHFSALGARTMTNFWEQSILTNGVRELVGSVGSYSWEDSVEIEANVYWTKNFSNLFSADHDYSISKWLPILFHRNGHAKQSNPSVWFVTDEPDSGDSHIADYRATLAIQYQAYLNGLNSWTRNYLNLHFSSQISYNLPMDMLANIPTVDVPECESLDFSDLIDGYRQYAGPANFAGRQIVSSECGAVRGEAYIQSLPELLWHVKRSFAGSINQFVFHGFPYSGDYGNTTWPVFTTFDYQYSAMHGPHEPAWDFYKDQVDFVARNNFIWQTGVAKMDIAFWQKVTVYPGHIQTRTYQPDDLERVGFSYEYLSPDNFNLPTAGVENGILAPDAQGFKALVVRANDSLTIEGVTKLGEFANAGLPIIFSGGVPSFYLGTNSAAELQNANQTLGRLSLLPNVHVTPSYAGLADTIVSLGIVPLTKLSSNVTWSTYWRSDSANNADYVYIYNDAPYSQPGEANSEGSIEFQSTGIPYDFDAWTGAQTPILTYTQTNSSTIIPLSLSGNQSMIIAFLSAPLDSASPGNAHLTKVPDSIVGVRPSTSNGNLIIQSGPSTSAQPVERSNGTFQNVQACQASSFNLFNWSLIVEHWDPPANLYSIEAGASKSNTTHQLTDPVPWSTIPSLQNVSGRGYYSTSFRWPPPSSSPVSGAILDFGTVAHTLRASLNGRMLPPLDVSAARTDIKGFLVNGTNKLDVVVATPLGNVLRTIWNQLETSGTGPSAVGQPAPGVAEYGLRAPVMVVPYIEVEV